MLIFIASLAVISLHGTILMPFLSYFARFTWRGRIPATGILAWKWSKVEIPILRNSKRRKNQRGIFPDLSKILGRRSAGGAPGGVHKPAWRGLPLARWPPSSAIWRVSSRKKIREELFRGFAAATRRNLSRSNLELRQDDPAGETSLPEGEIVAIVITNTPLIGGDSSPSTSSSAPSHLQTLVHHL